MPTRLLRAGLVVAGLTAFAPAPTGFYQFTLPGAK
jgi:hypothetical protein